MNFIKTVVTAILAGSLGVYATLYYVDIQNTYESNNVEMTVHAVNDHGVSVQEFTPSSVSTTRRKDPLKGKVMDSFVEASDLSTSSVVFIKNLNTIRYRNGHWADWFFEPRASQRISTGSGVIFSENGYIVTNNHVIDGADEIEVIHGKRIYKAELIGTDPSTDIAVIKVADENLPGIALGSSKDVRVGEWVLAVGNPFNLTSTVTAGIVSAKGRNINILRDKFPIESFIQTDAAINPGNSGGALVNAKGELIGINTAILSRTGSYAGYGFAIPVDIVKKVVDDLIKYGEVQKALLGAEYIDIDSEIADELDIDGLNGVLVTNVQKGWAADRAGLRKGDVILTANAEVIEGKSDLEETLGYMYPGDKLEVNVVRGDKKITKTINLTNKQGTTSVIKKEIYYSESLKVSFESVPKAELDLLGVESGVRIVKIGSGFFSRLDIPEDFIVTDINSTQIESPKELEEILERVRGRVIISGITSNGRKVYYPYRF